MAQITCNGCGRTSSHTYSPSKYEGYFLRDDIIVELGIRGHQQFNTMLDFLEFLQQQTEYLYKCKYCGTILSAATKCWQLVEPTDGE